MKTISAFVRNDCVDAVLDALSGEPVLHVMVSHVHAAGPSLDDRDGRISVEFGRRVNRMGRIEIVCLDKNESRITETIRRTACTGHPGDGAVVVTNVTRLVEICERRTASRHTGEEQNG